MKRFSILLLGLAALGAGGYAALGDALRAPSKTPSADGSAGGPAERSAGEPGSSTEEAAELRSMVARLNAEVAALREQMADQPPGGNDAHAANPEPRRDDPAELAQQQEEWRAHMMGVDAEFQSEAIDARWASSASSAVKDALNACEAMRGTLRDVECRSQTCRVEIADDGSGGLSKELPIFVQALAEVLPSVQANHVDEGDGQRTVVLYMTRADGVPPATAATSRR